MNHTSIEQTLEAISGRGCDYVKALLLRAQNGESILEMQHLSLAETTSVLAELQAVMAVYRSDAGV